MKNGRTKVGWAGLGKAVLCEEAMISRQPQNGGGQIHERSSRPQSLQHTPYLYGPGLRWVAGRPLVLLRLILKDSLPDDGLSSKSCS